MAFGRVIVDAVSPDEFLRRVDGIAHGGAELGRAGLRIGQRALGSIRQDQPAVEGIGREDILRQLVVCLLIGLAELQPHRLRGMRVGKLVEHDDRTGRHDDTLTGRADEAYEVRIDQRRTAIELALEAALGKALQGKRPAGARTAVEKRVGLRRHHLQHLRAHARIRPRVALVGDDFDAGRVGGAFRHVVDEIAPGIRKADEADRLDVLHLHLVDDDAEHVARVLRDRNRPGLLVDLRHARHRRRRDDRHLEFARNRDEGRRRRCARGPHDDVDLVFLDQLARVLRRG